MTVLRERKKLGLTTVQVAASGLSAVTAALAASFFGVGGTIAGAAFGSIISTVAGALYSHSLDTAQQRLRQTGSILVQRVPVGVARQPTAIPQAALRQQAGGEQEELTTVAMDVPVVAPKPEAQGVPREGPPRWRRPALLIGAICLAGFVLAMGVITLTEAFLGHPVSGGSGGTSVSTLVDGDNRASTPTTTVTTTPSTTSTVTPESSTTTGPTPIETPQQTASPTEAPTATETATPQPTSTGTDTGDAAQDSAATAAP